MSTEATFTPRIRSLKGDDRAFVFSTMLRGLYHGCDFYNKIDKASFFKHYGAVAEALLAKPGVEVRVACLPDDEDIILGYLIMERDVLHYAFVKEPWRSKGIAHLLLGVSAVTCVTHLTKPGNAIRLKKAWTFDPFQI